MNRCGKLVIASVLAAALSAAALLWISVQGRGQKARLSPYPDGRDFAFSITDDPDHHKLAKIRLVYDLLVELGMRTTVAVWVKEAERSNGVPDVAGDFDYGATLQDADYRDYILRLHDLGFEIAVHTITGGNDLRDTTVSGYEEFRELFGYYPRINIMHSKNLEDIYWGSKVFSNAVLRWFIHDVVGSVFAKAAFPFSGEVEDSPFFWGDIAREKTKYVRLWGTSDINTLAFNPTMPYHDPRKPYVNYWFSFSDGYNSYFFKKLLTDENMERLVRERGTSIVYTHFAAGFAKRDGKGDYYLDPDFVRQMRKLASYEQGWFVPVSVILDRLLAMKNVNIFEVGDALVVNNSNTFAVDGVTLLVEPGALYYDMRGRPYRADGDGEIVVGDLGPGRSVTLRRDERPDFLVRREPGWFERLNMVVQRSLIWIFSHNK